MSLVVSVGFNDIQEPYDSFLLSFENTLLFQSYKYIKFIEEICQAENESLVVKNETADLLAVLPLLSKRGPYGKVYNSLPFYGSHGGILSKDERATSILLQKYLELVNSEDVAAATLVESPFFRNFGYDKLQSNESDHRIGQITQLPKGEDIEQLLMNSFHYKTRNMVRKAMKFDLKVKVDNSAIDYLKDVHIQNMQSIGGKPKSNAFFKHIPQFFKANEDYKIYVAEKEGKFVAALLLFYFNGTVEYFTPVIDAEFRSMQPMSLIILYAMIDSISAGYKQWNWGGTWPSQEGVYRFKSRWNANDYPYSYYTYVKNNNLYGSNPTELSNCYSDFYVIPFSKLSTEK